MSSARSSPSIVIFGAGAIGAFIGGSLVQAGTRVVLVDPWFQNVDAMKRNGLTVETPDGRFVAAVDALHLDELAGLPSTVDLLIVAVKSYDTEWAVRLMREYISTSTWILSAQNGLNEDLIATLTDPDQVVGCVISMAAEMFEPGITRRTTPMGSPAAIVGELDGLASRRVEQILDVMRSIGSIRMSSNIRGELWSKLTLNAMSNSMCGLTGQTPRSLWNNQRAIAVELDLAAEAVAVSEAVSIDMTPVLGRIAAGTIAAAHHGDPRAREEAEAALRQTAAERTGKNENKSSLLVDVLKHRRTEIDYLNGSIVRIGSEHGVATPTNEAMVELIHRVERQLLEPDIANLEFFNSVPMDF